MSLAAFAADLLPHGICLSWRPDLILLHAISDVVTAIAYYSIPLMLLVFVWRRRDLQFRWMFVLFGVFIMACGATHVMSLWTLWYPDYLAQGIVKAVTAFASVGTAIILYPLIPKALALPGPAQWEAVHRSLRSEVAERREAEAEVRRLNAELEARVSERTAELEATARELAAANRELRVREERFRQVVESAPYAMLLVGRDGRISLVNAQTEKLFGHARDDLIGQAIEILVPERFRASHPAHRAPYFAHPEARSMGADRELHGVHKDGREIPVEIGLNPIESEEGKLVLASIVDISARKEAEADRRARQVAEAASVAKSRFLASMSHELRTPLNAILGYAQIIKRDAGLAEASAAGLRTIEQSGQHLLVLINDLLDLAKVEAGKLELCPAAVDLAAFLPSVADIVRIRADEKRLRLAREWPSALPCVLADEKRLRQVLLNLLGNAVKFTDQGSVSLRVETVASSESAVALRFEVIDSGVGIGAGDLASIFEPFEQAGDVRRRSGGTGLGLAISRQLVRLMGAEIEVDSRPGAGSRFWFTLALPIVGAEAGPPADVPGDPAARTADEPGLPFAIPPHATMEIFHRLARHGDVRGIRRQAAQLGATDARYRPLANRFDDLAQRCQSKAILALVEKHLEAGETS